MRSASIIRKTAETDIQLQLSLDSYHEPVLHTGIPFFSHMLNQVALHGRFGINLTATGDIDVDIHHTVEDVGIVLGQALAKCLGDKRAIARYAQSIVPLDEALSRVVVDISGRPGLFYRVAYTANRVGAFDVQTVREFFQGIVNHAGITLHIDNLQGVNAHHQVESIFKAFGRALRQATRVEDAGSFIPSTKKSL